MVDDKHLSTSFVEQVVIGCCLAEKGLIKQALSSLNENDFYHTNTRKIFSVIREQYLIGRECDAVLLKQYVDEKEYKFAVGCITSVINISFFKDYVIRVKENSVKHQFKQIGIEIQEIDDAEVGNAKVRILAKISALSSPGEEEEKDRMEVMLNALNELERLRLRGGYEMRSRISGLDELLGGFCRRRVYVLGAKSSFGKTTFAIMCSYKIAAFDNVPVNFYSLEMSSADIIYKTLTLVTADKTKFKEPVPIWKMQKPKYLLQADKQALFRGLDVIYKIPLQIKTEHKTLDQILSDIQKTKPGFAVIDFLQYLPKIYINRNEKERDIYERHMKDITQCSKESNSAILALSQIKRGAQADGISPDQSDFQGSSSIEQLADVCMILHWPARAGGKISKKQLEAKPFNYQELHIVKNKYGVPGDVPLLFEGEFQTFTPCDKAGVKTGPQGGDKNA